VSAFRKHQKGEKARNLISCAVRGKDGPWRARDRKGMNKVKKGKKSSIVGVCAEERKPGFSGGG